jgi:hypothetical protein
VNKSSPSAIHGPHERGDQMSWKLSTGLAPGHDAQAGHRDSWGKARRRLGHREPSGSGAPNLFIVIGEAAPELTRGQYQATLTSNGMQRGECRFQGKPRSSNLRLRYRSSNAGQPGNVG